MRAMLNSTLAAAIALSAAVSIALGDPARADLAVVGSTVASSPPVPVPVMQKLDLQRYSGAWFEQARLPNRFQHECAANVVARYTVQAGGELKVVNGCSTANGDWREVQGEGRRVPALGAPQGQLEVRFAPTWLSWLSVVWADYWVIDVDADYKTALVGTPDREYLWLLSREPALPPAELKRWLDKAAQWGFPMDKVTVTQQAREALSQR